MKRIIILWVFLILLANSLSTNVYAANDPGHDTLYIEQVGNSSLTGNLNISEDLLVTGQTDVSALTLYGDGTNPSSGTYIAAASGGSDWLRIGLPGNLYLKDDGGDQVVVGTSAVNTDFNVTGAIYEQNVRVCLSNGTNCISGTNGGNVTSVTAANGITASPTTGDVVLGLTGQALALHNLGTNGLIVRTGSGTVTARTLTGGDGIDVTNGDGVSGNPTVDVDTTVCRQDGSNCPAFGSGDGNITGAGVTNYIVKFTNATNVGVSTITDTGSLVTIASNTQVTGYVNSTTFVNASTDICITGGTCLSTAGTGSGNITGSGVTNTIPLWTSSENIDNSIITQSGSALTISGNINATGNLTSENIYFYPTADVQIKTYGNQQQLTIIAGDGQATDDEGGDLVLRGGDSVGSGIVSGGDVRIYGGRSGTVVKGGSVYIYGGTGLTTDGDTILAYNGSTTRGNVGIGLLTPQNELNINGDTNSTGDIYSGGYVNATTDVCIVGGTCLSSAGASEATVEGYIYDNDNTLAGAWTVAASGSNDITFDTTTFFIDVSADNVGIGTTAPTSKLSVAGNASITSTANPALAIGSTSTGYLRIGGSTISDPNSNLYLDSDTAQVEIADDLQVTGNDIKDSSATTRITLGAETQIASGTNFSADSNLFNIDATNNRIILNGTSNQGGFFEINQKANDAFGGILLNPIGGGGIGALFVDTTGYTHLEADDGTGNIILGGTTGGGYVGIGTTPSQALSVAGNILATRSGVPAYLGLTDENEGVTWTIANNGSTAANFEIRDNGVNKFTIVSDAYGGGYEGNVGVGMVSLPTTRLQVNGSILADNINTSLTNIAIGNSLATGISGNYNTIVGGNIGGMNGATYITAIGYAAGSDGYNGTNTVLIGPYAGGDSAINDGIGIGNNVGYQSSGDDVIAIGHGVAVENHGDNTTIIGHGNSGYLNLGDNSIMIGNRVGYQNSGDNVIAFGYRAGEDNTANNVLIIKQYNVNTIPLIYGNFSTGSIGINTSSRPTQALSVTGNINVSGTGQGNIYYQGNLTGYGADLAENVFSEPNTHLEAGDVVVLSETMNEAVTLSTQAYDTKVAGIVSSDPSHLMSADKGDTPLALAGRVPVKASAENGVIARGDLLTTSNTPGHVMRCESREVCSGAIVGKAMSPLNENTGLITALVMLG